MDAVLVRNADRMMLAAALLEDGIGLTFADGCRGVVPFVDLPEVGGSSEISGLELPNPYEVILITVLGDRVEIPWDFARHYCDQSYRPTIEAIAIQGRRTLGERIRGFRESAGLTQEALARSADIGRVTLVRLENGEQTPRFRTLEAIAGALGQRVQDLLFAPGLLE
jgi:DNA-binding XRE family transcriptional regulator